MLVNELLLFQIFSTIKFKIDITMQKTLKPTCVRQILMMHMNTKGMICVIFLRVNYSYDVLYGAIRLIQLEHKI